MSELEIVEKCLKLELRSSLTLIQGLIFHELQQLGHANLMLCIDLNLPTFAQSLALDLYIVKKCSKSQLKQIWPILSPDISRTAWAMTSNFCVKLRLEISNNFSKSGVWTTNGAEMLKARIKSKFDLNSWVYISRTTIASGSKFDVVLWLELINICLKSGV